MSNHFTVLDVSVFICVGNGNDAYVKVCCQLRQTHRQLCQCPFLALLTTHRDNVLDRLKEHILAVIGFLHQSYLGNQIISALLFLKEVLVEVLAFSNTTN